MINMEKIFIVSYGRGDYDDYRRVDIFATSNKEYAEKYIEKFNSLLLKADEHYSKMIKGADDYNSDRFSDKDGIFYDKYHEVKETFEAFLREIEIR